MKIAKTYPDPEPSRATTAFGVCTNEIVLVSNTKTSKVFETNRIMNTKYGVSSNAK